MQMNLFTKQKQTHRHRKQTLGSQRRKVDGSDKKEYGINTNAQLDIQQIYTVLKIFKYNI